jgi:uncharacterized protein YbaP (TraB family)
MLWEFANTPHRLLGSIHILPDNSILPDWVEASHKGIRRFVFERDNGDMSDAAIGIDKTRAHLKFQGAPDIYLRAKKFLGSIGRNEPFEDHLPWSAAFHISVCVAVHLKQYHHNGVESRFRALAHSNKLSVEFLESPKRCFELIHSSYLNEQHGLAYLESVVTHAESGKLKSKMERIAPTWYASDLKGFTTIHNEGSIECPPFFNAVVTQRNREWANVAKRIAAESVPTLFVIGSIHTVGSGSFIENMENAGFEFKFIS